MVVAVLGSIVSDKEEFVALPLHTVQLVKLDLTNLHDAFGVS